MVGGELVLKLVLRAGEQHMNAYGFGSVHVLIILLQVLV
jgi:hypothetical protein